jgi:redox-sensitive bicupin YhaK (pirin superfamily)
MHGFQIWVNVPSEKKMDDPRYGTHDPTDIPILTGPGITARLIAGDSGVASDIPAHGPFQTVTAVQIVDFSFEPNIEHVHHVPSELNNCLIYIYSGSGELAGETIKKGNVAHLDASDGERRGVKLTSGEEGVCRRRKRVLVGVRR